MPTAVVTGANSGIGHAFAEIYLDQGGQDQWASSAHHMPADNLLQGYDVYAADREVGDGLQSLNPARLHRLDVASPESVAAFAQQLSGKPIDVLLNVAGVMAPHEQDSLENTNMDVLQRTFAVNTFGVLLLTQALLPNLQASENKPSRVGIVSSRVGSIADNSSGGSYAYRSSKAAVNSIGKSLSVDLKDQGIVVSLLHPGITNTNMIAHAKPHPESVEPEEAASKLWKVFVSKDITQTGQFWHREGNELPW